MPRIRTLTALGVLAGATVLGGAGLAGATDRTDVEPALVEDLTGEATQEPSTGEPEATPIAPELPEEAAVEALEAAPALGGDATTGDAQTGETDDAESTEADAPAEAEQEAPTADTHGAPVSEAAQSDDPGPEHGPAVAAVAKSHGEVQRGDDAQEPESADAPEQD